MHKKISKEWYLIIGLAALKLIIHFSTNTNYELHRDSFLYYSLGEHLDWGYVSVPPLIAILSKLSVILFGNTTFALRFFPAIVGSISVVLIARIVQELKGGKWAIFIAVLAFMVSPSFLRSNTLFQPVSFNQFSWLLSGYLIVRLIKTGNPKLWIGIFIVFGVSFLNKYSITFFIISFLLSILLTQQRVLLKSKYFFIGGAMGILIIAPNLFWQYNNGWPLLVHMSELQKYQFVNVSKIGFIIDQLIMNFPALLIWMTGFIVFLFFKAEKQYKTLALTSLFTILMILTLGGKSYYTLGVYPIMFALGAFAIEKYFRNWIRVGVLVLMVLISIPMLPLSLPVLSFENLEQYTKNSAQFTNRWEDGKIHSIPQDYADMIAWKELSNIVIKTYEDLPDESKKNCAIYAEDYCTAGAILFYGKEHGLPEPISFSDNFLLWAPDSISPEIFIYVNDEIGDMEWLFENSVLVGQINNKYFREDGIQVYLCTQPKDVFPSFYVKKVAKLKSKYHQRLF